MVGSKWKKGALVGSLVLGMAVSAVRAAEPAPATDPSQQEMYNELKALRAEVQDLRQQQQAQKEVYSAKQVDQTVADLTADANKRSQLMAETQTLPNAGYNKGLFIQSENGDFSMKTNLILQIRNVTTDREDGKNGGTDNDIQHGWEVRRAKILFTGNVFGKDITYKLQFANETNGAPIDLDDAWINYAINKQWNVQVGQFKAPFTHEEFGVGDTDQIAVERSLLNQLLGGGAVGPRVQGIDFFYKTADDKLRAQAMLGDGDQSANTNFLDNAGTPDTRSRWGATGRVEYMLYGDWNEYKDFSARGNKVDLLVLGGGVDVSQAPSTTPSGTIYRGTVDAQWENTKGLGLYGALIANYSENNSVGADITNWGWLVQAGYMLDPKWELFGRADVTYFDEDAVVGDDTFAELGVGITRFLGKDGIAGHQAQITFDINYLPSSVPTNQTGLGYLANNGQNEFVARLQFQLAI